MATYTTIGDYIAKNITPGLGGIRLTNDQAHEVAHRMTKWSDGKLTEREDLDFWHVVDDVLCDN